MNETKQIKALYNLYFFGDGVSIKSLDLDKDDINYLKKYKRISIKKGRAFITPLGKLVALGEWTCRKKAGTEVISIL